MTRIEISTLIKGNAEEVFDLSRNIDFHLESAHLTDEKAISGITSGLIGLNETVTWEGKHFGFWLQHTSKIVKLEKPNSFVDLMIDGHFTYFVHKHEFTQEGAITIMKDQLLYKVPYGILGKIFDKLVLKRYLTHFLRYRNEMIKKEIQKGGKRSLVNHKLLSNARTVLV